LDPEDFATDVLVPLAAGGVLNVRAPLDADDVASLREARARMPGLAELAEARRMTLVRFLRDAPAPDLDDDAIYLGAAIHNLCWLLAQPHHEDGGRSLQRIAAYTAHLCALPPPRDELALTARHALVGRMRSLSRRDVRVRFWAGHREFRGETPPARLLRWQSLRRVRQEQSTVDLFTEAIATPATRAIVVALLAASPLTDLLGVERTDPLIDLKNAARWLRSPSIARALADEYLRRGLQVIEPGLTVALIALYNVKGATADAATATAFHSHLHLLELLARPNRDREGHLQVIRGHAQGRERSAPVGFGLFAAADRIGLGRPGDVARDATLSANIDAYVLACAELVGQRRMQELTGLVARGAGNRARMS